MASAEPNFMDCPLVIWVDTFRKKGSPKLQYSDLYNGVFLMDVMQQIDPRPAYQNVVRIVRDVNIRLQNWDILLKNIRAYYADVLQQLLIQKLPNISCICREPEKDTGFNELKKVLLLILGCAVQCERKEEFIKVIMNLEVSVQQEIVESIKQITDDSSFVLQTDCQDSDVLFGHLVNLIKERDNFAEVMTELVQERDFYQGQAEGKTVAMSPASTPEKQQIVVELTECKARIRKLKQELDEKQEQLSDVRDECDEHKLHLSKLRTENMDLLKDARSARSLRDELDILREKVSKVNSYEAEILKYKEKLNEMDFYKARVEELRDDNRILVESKAMLDHQLSSSHKRIETVVQLEQQLVKYRQQIEELSTERDADSDRISSLVEENAQLQFDKKMNMNESTNLEQEIQASKAKIAGVGGAISDQLKETTNAKILRLELENQHLLRKLDDMKESSLIEKTTLHLQLEKENQRLVKKMEKFQQDNTEFQQKCYEFEEKNRELSKEKEHFVKTLEYTKECSERQLKELEQQNEDLSQTVEVIRTRNEQTNDTKLKNIEKENKRLHETIAEKNQHLTKLEFSNRQLQKTTHRTQDNIDKISQLEHEKDTLERATLDLKHRLQAQEMASEKVDKLEQDYSDMEIENQKLQKKTEHLQTALHKKEKVDQENINMKVENQKLQRMLDNLKTSATKVAELESDNSMLRKELQQQQRIIEMKKSQDGKLEKMELDLMDLDNENMKLQKQLEITTARMQQLERDNVELESEHENLQEKLEPMKYSQKRMSELELVNSELEKEFMKVQKENTQLTKENKRNKNTLEARESAIDELTSKHSMLELTHKELQRSVERDKGSGVFTRETDNEHRELVRNLQVEKQAVSTLRTDLMNEKIKSQELHNELEKLHQDLERVGIKKDQLMNSSPLHHEDGRFKALESMMEDALNKSVSIRDDKIHALESRLEESKNRNLNLQEELRLTRRECESLKQRFEEESLGKEREREETRLVKKSPFMNSGGDQNQTDHLVKLERNNAKLMVESDNLKSRNDSLNEQIKKLESQNSKLQSHNTTVQSEKSALQSHNAQLQVETAKIKAHCDSLQTQYRDLQNTHEQVMQDHENMQKMHDQSTREFESMISEHGSLKSVHKSLERENRDLHQQINNLIHVKDDDSKMRDWLSREREQLQMKNKAFGDLQMKYSKLQDEHDRLLKEYEKLKNALNTMEKDNRELVYENKSMKTDYNNMLQDNAEYKEKLRNIEGDLRMLADKYDSLDDVYQKTLEDKEHLMSQLELLIGKNQELLSHVLNNKDQMAGKEKSYMEQLSDLRRQKERLEEKIMEHYKNRDKQKKNKSLGAILLQKVRGLKRSKSRPNLNDGSPDNSSMGSGTLADQDNKPDKRRYRRRRGSNAGFLGDTNSPKLSKHNKGLAKSTTALDTSPTTQRHSFALSEYRGARSTEDLLSDTLRSHGDNVSLSNSTFSLLPGMGRPVSDDEGGFGRAARQNSTSEFMTLEEFLAEGVDRGSPKQKRKIELKAEDTESRSSENSDGRPPRRRPAPQPPSQQGRPRIGSIPDVAAQSDLSLSRLSRVSTGSSGGSSQDVRPESAFSHIVSPPYNIHPNNTSTPAKPQNTGYRVKAFEDFHNSSAFSRVQGQDANDSYNNSPQYNNKGPRENDIRLTPDARLDILTKGNQNSSAFSPTSPTGVHPHLSNHSSPNDSRSRSHDNDMSIRSGPPQPSPQQQQGWNRSQQGQVQGHSGQSSGQRPVKATQPHYPRSHSPARLSQQQQQYEDQSAQQSTPQRKGNILVSRADIGAGQRPYGQQRGMVRARPASAFGAPVSMNNSLQGEREQQMNSSFQSPLNNSRPSRLELNNSHVSNQSQSDLRSGYDNSYNNSPGHPPQHTNGPMNNMPVHRRRQPNMGQSERPKSVPPTMFNAQLGGSDSDSSYNNNDYNQSNHIGNKGVPNHVGGNKGTPPVPPPRKTKDILTTGRYSIMTNREPMSPTKQGPGSRVGLNNTGNAQTGQGQRGPTEEQQKKEIWKQKKVTFDIDDLPESMIM